MDTVTGAITSTIFSRPMKIGDRVDTLHDFYAFIVLIVIAAVVGYKEHDEKAISCWSPPEISDSQEHVNYYCWSSTMINPKHQDGPPNSLFGNTFYKWAVLFIIAQAITFKIPYLLWSILCGSTGGHMTRIRDLAEKADACNTDEERENKLKKAFKYFDGWVAGYSRCKNWKKFSPKGCCCQCFDRCLEKFMESEIGTIVSSLYLFVKFLNLLNVAINFVLVSLMLDSDFSSYGINSILSIFNSGDWHDDYSFPRILVCDYNVTKADGTSSSYKVQCHMLTYSILDKAFVLEWFLFLILFVVTFLNLLFWFVTIKPPFSVHFFKKSFPLSELDPTPETGLQKKVEETVLVPDFVRHYLKSDGVMTIRLLERYVNKDVMHLFIEHTWSQFQKGDPMKELSEKKAAKKREKEAARLEKETGSSGSGKGPSLFRRMIPSKKRSSLGSTQLLDGSRAESYRSIEMDEPPKNGAQ